MEHTIITYPLHHGVTETRYTMSGESYIFDREAVDRACDEIIDHLTMDGLGCTREEFRAMFSLQRVLRTPLQALVALLTLSGPDRSEPDSHV